MLSLYPKPHTVGFRGIKGSGLTGIRMERASGVKCLVLCGL